MWAAFCFRGELGAALKSTDFSLQDFRALGPTGAGCVLCGTRRGTERARHRWGWGRWSCRCSLLWELGQDACPRRPAGGSQPGGPLSCAVASRLVFPNSELLPFCQAGAASPPRELVFLHALGTGSPSPSFLSFWEVAPVNAAKTGA